VDVCNIAHASPFNFDSVRTPPKPVSYEKRRFVRSPTPV
jgi:hypothetical protein